MHASAHLLKLGGWGWEFKVFRGFKVDPGRSFWGLLNLAKVV